MNRKQVLLILTVLLTLLLIVSKIIAQGPPPQQFWRITGNANTDPTANFLGTTDNQPLVFRTSSLEAMRIDTNGNVFLGSDNDLVCNDCIQSTDIEDGVVATSDLANNAVTSTKIADGAVNSAKLFDGSVDTADLANGAVTGDKLAANAVDSSKIVDGTITTDEIADGAVNSAKLFDGSVDTADLANGAVTGDKLAANAVDSSKIVDGTITTDEIADGAVNSAKLFDGSVDTADLANGAVTGDKLAANAVDSSKIVDGTITTDEIADGAVNGAKILDSSVDTADLADGSVTGDKLNTDNGFVISGNVIVNGPPSPAGLSITANGIGGSNLQIENTVPGGIEWNIYTGDNGCFGSALGIGPTVPVGSGQCGGSLGTAMIIGENGGVFVAGNHTVGGTKSAVVDTEYFGSRMLYAAESPEVRFFDEGLARLEEGVTRVDLDPIFLDTIEGEYLVHVTPYGNASLYVAEIGKDYFVVKVREGDPDVSFAWRLSAYRKGYAGTRLEEVGE